MDEVRIKIHGQVHVVGFRYYTTLQARDLNLTGYARNLPDESVEIVAQGTKENLEQLVDWAKTGPRHSRIEKVVAQFSNSETKYTDFQIL